MYSEAAGVQLVRSVGGDTAVPVSAISRRAAAAAAAAAATVPLPPCVSLLQHVSDAVSFTIHIISLVASL